jgi:hypothetical protein
VLDWVFADGPPGNAKKYDNNGKRDFHAVVSNNIFDDLFWMEEEHRIFERLQRERKEREDAGRRKVSSRDAMHIILEHYTYLSLYLINC